MTSYEELYEKYATDVLRVSYFYLGDRQRAEDVCQDVFVRLITNAPQLEEGREKAWLLKVALNRCRDLWRGAWVKRVTGVTGVTAVLAHPHPLTGSAREAEDVAQNRLQDTSSFRLRFGLHLGTHVRSHADAHGAPRLHVLEQLAPHPGVLGLLV